MPNSDACNITYKLMASQISLWQEECIHHEEEGIKRAEDKCVEQQTSADQLGQKG